MALLRSKGFKCNTYRHIGMNGNGDRNLNTPIYYDNNGVIKVYTCNYITNLTYNYITKLCNP